MSLSGQIEKPEAILVSVGGGGLIAGILQGLQAKSWTDVDVYGVETRGAASFAAAMKAKERVSIPRVRTIAKNSGTTTNFRNSFSSGARLWRSLACR